MRRATMLLSGALVTGSLLISGRGYGGAVDLVSFETPIDLAGQAHAKVIAIADATGDGRADVVLAGYSDADFSVFPGNSDGTFGARQTTMLSAQQATRMAVARLNADVADDFVVNHGGAATVDVLVSDGSGGFTVTAYDAPDGTTGETETPLLIDWDGDDDLDIFSVSRERLRVRRNTGSGQFDAPETVTLPDLPGTLATATSLDAVFSDLDADGDEDLYLAVGSGFIAPGRVYWRQTDLSFTSGPLISLGVGGRVVAADFDGDSYPDLAGVGVTGGPPGGLRPGVRVVRHVTATTFEFTGMYTLEPFTPVPHGLVAADVDGDGRVDLVTSTGLFLNSGDGRFAAVQQVPGSAATGGWGVAAANLDGDPHPDIATAWHADDPSTVAASVFPIRVVPVQPVVAAFSPSTLYPGGTVDLVVTGSGFKIDGTIDLGADVSVNRLTVETKARITANVTIAPDALLGARVATVGNPGGKSVAVPITVAEGGVAEITSLTPDRAHAGDTLDIVVRGSSLVSDPAADLGPGVIVEQVTLHTSTMDRFVLRATISEDATPGPRELAVLNGSGILSAAPAAFHVLPPRSVDLRAKKGSLRASARAGRSAISARGSLAFNALSPDGAFDPVSEPAELRFGAPEAPTVITIPAGAGWVVKGSRATYRSARSATPRVDLVLDFARRTFRLDVDRTDLTGPDDRRVMVEITLGTETGTSVRTWRRIDGRRLAL